MLVGFAFVTVVVEVGLTVVVVPVEFGVTVVDAPRMAEWIVAVLPVACSVVVGVATRDEEKRAETPDKGRALSPPTARAFRASSDRCLTRNFCLIGDLPECDHPRSVSDAAVRRARSRIRTGICGFMGPSSSDPLPITPLRECATSAQQRTVGNDLAANRSKHEPDQIRL